MIFISFGSLLGRDRVCVVSRNRAAVDNMATLFQEEDTQYSLRIGDTVLLYAKERKGFVFSELTRYTHHNISLAEC